MSAEIIQHPAMQRRAAMAANRQAFPLRRRHVIFVPDYERDAQDEHRKRFAVETDRFASTYDAVADLGPPRPVGEHGGEICRIAASGAGWEVEAHCETSPWARLIETDHQAGGARRLSRAATAGLRQLRSGALATLFATKPLFAAAMLAPFAVLLLVAALAAAGGILAGLSLSAAGLAELPAAGAGLVLAMMLGHMLALFAGRLHPMDDRLARFHATAAYLAGERPDWDEEVDRLTTRLCDVAARNEVDEVLVVGRGAGALIAADAVDRALRLDPRLGMIGPRLSLLTVGRAMAVVEAVPQAAALREALVRLSSDSRLTWVEDEQPPEGPRRTPRARGAQAERQGQDPFDVQMIALGPIPLTLRARQPEAALAAVLPDRRATAWKRLAAVSEEI